MFSKIKDLIEYFRPKKKDISLALLEICRAHLGQNLCSNFEYGAAETINNVVEMATGKPIGGGNGNSTYIMFWLLQRDAKRFEEKNDPLPGFIVISPTGLGTDTEKVGNVGIIGTEGSVYSNDHKNGKLSNHIKLDEWVEHYTSLGFPVRYFEIKK